MEIVKADAGYTFSEEALALGNCYLAIADKDYEYEFTIINNTATIKTTNLEYIEEVVEEFRKTNKYINIFKTLDGNFYKEYEQVPTFKLPINIIQISKPFLNQTKITNFEKYFNPDECYLPVQIIDDEYVLLDGHHRLYTAKENYLKMVNVYLAEITNDAIYDMVYVAKERNLKNINDAVILSDEEFASLIELYQ